MIVRIGTRRSRLALRQAELVQTRLGVESEIVTLDTKGDRYLDSPLFAIGSKGLFTAELEEALLAGEIDLAVHSLKDLPTADHPELPIVGISQRESPYDCLVLGARYRDHQDLDNLPAGSVIGTSSLRRTAFLKYRYPHLEVISLRGNIETRLRKIEEGVDGLAGGILAYAGLERLGRIEEASQIISAAISLPAPGQGALGIQASISRLTPDLKAALLHNIHDPLTATLVKAERSALRAIEGGCLTPFGALAEPLDFGSSFRIRAALAKADGSDYREAFAEGSLAMAEEIGYELGLSLKIK